MRTLFVSLRAALLTLVFLFGLLYAVVGFGYFGVSLYFWNSDFFASAIPAAYTFFIGFVGIAVSVVSARQLSKANREWARPRSDSPEAEPSE